MSMQFKRKMPIPKVMKEEYPMTAQMQAVKDDRDREISSILRGESSKLLVLVGPCSADREKPVLDYITRLQKVQEKVQDKLILVPRVYTNKPRTKCNGYMGMIFQPDPQKEEDILEGIISVRKLHLKVLCETGLSAADELLYPEDYRYISDVLSYVAVGARSVENQQHRLTASGLDIPVGIKNPTSGSMEVMLNTISAVQSGHNFLYRGWEVESTGNPLAHAILRGLYSLEGKNVPNYYYENLLELYQKYEASGLENRAVIIDTNHANSNKKPLEQIRICREIMEYRRYSTDIKEMIKGFMIESYLKDGAQKIEGNEYGMSVTDPCLGWEKTEGLLYEIAEKV